MSPIRSIVSAAALALGLGAAASAADFKIDPDHSTAIFAAGHLGISHLYGRFDDVSGTIGYDAADPAKGAIEVVIQAASIDTHQEKRDQHLKSPDFFDVKQFPTLGFKSTSFKALDDKTLEVAGNLTIHGVTKPVTVKVAKIGEGKDPWGGVRVGFATEFDIKRSDFGMTNLPDAVKDEVHVIIAIEGIRK